MKDFLVRLGLHVAAPSAVRGAILGIVGFMALKNGWVPGVTTNAATHVTTIAWSKVSDWAIAGLPALTAAVLKLLSYHGSNLIKGGTSV